MDSNFIAGDNLQKNLCHQEIQLSKDNINLSTRKCNQNL